MNVDKPRLSLRVVVQTVWTNLRHSWQGKGLTAVQFLRGQQFGIYLAKPKVIQTGMQGFMLFSLFEDILQYQSCYSASFLYLHSHILYLYQLGNIHISKGNKLLGAFLNTTYIVFTSMASYIWNDTYRECKIATIKLSLLASTTCLHSVIINGYQILDDGLFSTNLPIYYVYAPELFIHKKS